MQKPIAQTIKKVAIKEIAQLIDTCKTPLLINFWATWCKPCVEEIPWFEKSVAMYKDKKVQLVLVSLDFKTDYPNTLQQFVQKKKITSKVVWLNETNADYFCPFIDAKWNGNIPVTLMINKQIKYKQFYDHQLPEPQLKEALKKLVEYN